MAGRVLPAIFGPAEKTTERASRTDADAGEDSGAAGAGDEDLSGARLRIRRPARALRPNRPPACSFSAFEPSLHFVDLVHALDDDAPGRGGDFVLEGAEADADLDAPFDGSLDGLRVHVVLL